MTENLAEQFQESDTYERVTAKFAERVNYLFQSEETLRECFLSHFPRLEFDRTNHWSGILHKELDRVWREHGPDPNASVQTYDRLQVVSCLVDYLDFNLYSQVALNLQNWGVIQYGADIPVELKKMEEKWNKRTVTPLSPGATMIKNAWKPEDKDFNTDLSRVKALKTISQFDLTISFRVSPKGSTPALVDSQNFSTLGVGSDALIKTLPGYRVYFIAWKPGMTPPVLKAGPNGGFLTEGIPYEFFSKSGGTILNEVLFSRGIAVAFWSGISEHPIVLPRINSVMVVTNQDATKVRELYESLKKDYPMLEFHEKERKYGVAV